jgi:hypothetical protein
MGAHQMSKPDKKLNLDDVLQEYEALAVDLPETRIGVDVDYQTKRLEKINRKLRTLIHGGGTGED